MGLSARPCLRRGHAPKQLRHLACRRGPVVRGASGGQPRNAAASDEVRSARLRVLPRLRQRRHRPQRARAVAHRRTQAAGRGRRGRGLAGGARDSGGALAAADQHGCAAGRIAGPEGAPARSAPHIRLHHRTRRLAGLRRRPRRPQIRAAAPNRRRQRVATAHRLDLGGVRQPPRQPTRQNAGPFHGDAVDGGRARVRAHVLLGGGGRWTRSPARRCGPTIQAPATGRGRRSSASPAAAWPTTAARRRAARRGIGCCW